ncbi:MAG: hypothetical protein NXY59_02035 [Aigarchaeota archaeon]|nr:hypothetical protein [Candidatus Pelearchaeum maunauluense]
MAGDDGILNETLGLIDAAQQRGLTLRLLGGAGIRCHCNKYSDFYRALGRVIHDIDIITYGKQKNAINSFLMEQGFKKRPLTLTAAYSYREIFYKGEFVFDIFFDKLQMNHTIDFRNRLEMDFPTIPLAELLLQKVQIVQLTENDLKDIVVLLLEHELGNDDNDKINVERISSILADDWGFYYTVITNLRKVKELAPKVVEMPEEGWRVVYDKIDRLIEAIEGYPKTMGWKLRAKIGTHKKWYKEVERFEV